MPSSSSSPTSGSYVDGLLPPAGAFPDVDANLIRKVASQKGTAFEQLYDARPAAKAAEVLLSKSTLMRDIWHRSVVDMELEGGSSSGDNTAGATTSRSYSTFSPSYDVTFDMLVSTDNGLLGPRVMIPACMFWVDLASRMGLLRVNFAKVEEF